MKRNTTPAQTEEILTNAIKTFRRFSKKAGPDTHLQTREFREVVTHVKSIEEALKKPVSEAKTGGSKATASKETPASKETDESYLLYHFIRHYQEALSVLHELPYIPSRVLDVGSGAGSFALAAARRGSSEVVLADSNRYALELGADLFGRLGNTCTIRYWNFLQDVLPEGPFDLIALSYSFFEIANGSNEEQAKIQQGRLLSQCASRLSENGVLVIIDSSESAMNTNLLRLRDQFQEEGRKIIAPCIWTGKCPALKSKVPCFAQRPFEKPKLLAEIQRAASINLNSLKFSYLIVAYHQKAAPMPTRALYRVVSPALLIHNQKRYMLCGVAGKKLLGSPSEEIPKSCRAFEFLERGTVIEVENVRDEGEFFDFDNGSSISVTAAPGKPFIQ